MRATKKNVAKAKVAPELIETAKAFGKAAFERGVYACGYDQEFLDFVWTNFGTVIGINHCERIKLMDAWYYAQTTERLKASDEFLRQLCLQNCNQ